MKNVFVVVLYVGIILCGIFLIAQDIQHQVVVINIEIPVRVFKGDVFIDNLSIKDFDVFEDGKPQKIEAIYLINKTSIRHEEVNRREEEKKPAQPQVARQFVLFFEMSDYLPELNKTLDYFFDKVVLPGDSLIVLTPMKNYHLRSEALAQMPKEKVKEQLRGILRQDILMGGSEYRNTIADMRRVLTDDLPMDQKLFDYHLYLSKLESLRHVNEKGLLDFAAYLKGLPGQKYVYMFYQKEQIPQYSPNILMNIEFESLGDVSTTMKFLEMFELFNRDIGFSVDAVKKAYADSSIAVHLLFITKTPAVRDPVEFHVEGGQAGEIQMVERSEDIYGAFGDVARATGGIVDSSGNAAAAFARAVNASENYYLIYYKPKKYAADGSFHELKVKVTTGSYQVAHRAGYWAK